MFVLALLSHGASWRTIDSHGLAEASVVRPLRGAEALDGDRLGEALAKRDRGAGVGALELAGERAQARERIGVVGDRPGRAQPAADRVALGLGEVIEHVYTARELVASDKLRGAPACRAHRKRRLADGEGVDAGVRGDVYHV